MRVVAQITSAFEGKGYSPISVPSVMSYSVDSAMDTDTDSWTVEIGDPNHALKETLRDNNEVRVALYGLGNGTVETLHSGFVDEITLTQSNSLVFNGRDITSVAVDSQHPPQVWHQIRPHTLVGKEARQLKIGDRLKLTQAAPFKKYVTDGSESYWEVWYRFYRKRRMWMWGEPDGGINATPLQYDQAVSYYFSEKQTAKFIPVEAIEWRANKSTRVGEVFFFGHRGDKGFVARAVDPTTARWIKRPTKIITSSDVHSQSEARVEAWEEIFESKVGATEIQLTVKNPGFLIKQNRMAFVDLPSIGLKGNFFVVGVQIVGSITEGLYQIVRLRVKNYAISRRVPSDPVLKGTGTAESTLFSPTGVAAALSVRWKWFFVAAANKYHGPWPLELFLGVLLSICSQETGFRNVREGGSIEWPGSADSSTDFRTAHNRGESAGDDSSSEARFIATFANDPSFGRVKTEFGVGAMQLTTPGYKRAADKLAKTGIDELRGGRWNPQWNIHAAAAALAAKLGAGVSISSDGEINTVPITGLSLQPTENNIWAGVQAYNGSGPDAVKYMATVKNIYKTEFKPTVESAFVTARQDAKNSNTSVPGGASAELRKRVLNSNEIEMTGIQRDDVRYGLIHDDVLVCMLWCVAQGFPLVISALKSDHKHLGSASAHYWGAAFDAGNYGLKNPANARALMEKLRQEAISPQNGGRLKIRQVIGPYPELVFPLGIYDSGTLSDHRNHIHVGFAYQGHPLYSKGTT